MPLKIKGRRIEITAFERERIIIRQPARAPALVQCPICLVSTEMLTTRQAGELLQIKPQSIRRWLARGQAHGVRTSGGPHRVCRNSLFVVGKRPVEPPQPENGFDCNDQIMRLEPVRPLPQEPAYCE
jgi:hypothetical protein